MADEDAVIRRRLLTHTSMLGKTPLKKCAESVLGLFDALTEDSMDGESCKLDVEALLWEMDQLEFEANKVDILSFTAGRELEAYEILNTDIDKSISKVSKEIEELHTKVQVEKTIRAYKEEYESISRVINELPSRQELAAELTVEEKRLNDAQNALAAVDSKLDLRTKQFALLMTTIQNLKATLDEDVAMDEQDEQDDDQEAKRGQQDDEEMETAVAEEGTTSSR